MVESLFSVVLAVMAGSACASRNSCKSSARPACCVRLCSISPLEKDARGGLSGLNLARCRLAHIGRHDLASVRPMDPAIPPGHIAACSFARSRSTRTRTWGHRRNKPGSAPSPHTSLARLCAEQSKRQKAYDVLAPLHGWFTESFDIADLQEATRCWASCSDA
jgi:hypothetical protein